MSNDEMARELEKLRADVSALSEARNATATQPGEPTAMEEKTQAEPDAAASTGEEAPIPAETKSQFEELGALLQEEIRDLPTITCLTIFSLGILMGRLLR
jgi:hypothetical protein